MNKNKEITKEYRSKVKRNFKVYCLYMLLSGFATHALIAVLYFESLLNSYAMAMSVFTFVFLSSSFMEIPMGIMSDFIGRKKTMIFASVSFFVAICFYISAGYNSQYAFVLLFSGAFFQGICQALASGTDEAIVYETAKILGDKYDFKKYFSRGRGLQQLALGSSAFLSGFVVYFFDYVHCYIISFFVYLLWVVVSFWWVEIEDEDTKANTNNVFVHLKEAFSLFKTSKKLQYLSIANVIDDGSGQAAHRFEMVYFQSLIPEYIFGVPRLLKQICGFFSFQISTKVIKKFNPLNTLVYSTMGMGFVRLVSLLINNLYTPFIASLTNIFYGTTITAETDMLQEEFSNKQRATMRSLIGMGSSLMFGLFAILIGYIADISSPRTALLCFVSLKVIVLFIYIRIFKLK